MTAVMDKRLLALALYGEERELSDEAVAKALDTLPPNERLVIESRYSTVPLTLSETGKVVPWIRCAPGIGVSKERVRQLEARALRRLRYCGKLPGWRFVPVEDFILINWKAVHKERGRTK